MLALALLLWALPALADPPFVRVESQGDGIAIEAHISGAGTAAGAMALLTDYETLADYMPNVDSSYVVSSAGDSTLVRQVVSSRLLLNWTFRFVLAFKRTGPYELRFRRTEGSMHEYRGVWTVAPHKEGVEIVYKAYVETRLHLPFFLTSFVIKRQVGRMMPVLLNELARRESEVDRE